jgi:hypothetical protein
MVLEGSLVLICTALASSVTLKALDEEGMAGPVVEGGTQRHISLSSVVAIVVVANSMLFCSQSSTRWVLASTVMMLVSPDILSLR